MTSPLADNTGLKIIHLGGLVEIGLNIEVLGDWADVKQEVRAVMKRFF